MKHRLTHGEGHGHTEIRLQGGESILVLESLRVVKAMVVGDEWAVLRQDDSGQSEVHIRTSAVTALIDLEHEERHLSSVA